MAKEGILFLCKCMRLYEKEAYKVNVYFITDQDDTTIYIYHPSSLLIIDKYRYFTWFLKHSLKIIKSKDSKYYVIKM